MKQKFLLSLLFVCMFIVSSKAQINKNAIWLGGNIGFSQIKNNYEQQDENKTNSLSLRPAVGLAVKENLVAGVSLIYSKGKTDNYGYTGATLKENSYGGGLFVRQYIPVVSRLYFFGEAEAAYTVYRSKEIPKNNPVTETKGWFATLGLSPGISFGVNKRVQLESGLNNLFQLQYGKTKRKTDITGGDADIETFSAGINFEGQSPFYFGVRFLLNNKG
ncbi:porin family protein [Niastella caeni]|uniref:Porin family protein n=1 Tax=Niastella caeni TaxID=2569763 RepID=A0A4S8HQR0_9BACT|nr:porin family protein [Niastella caeni]THU37211.1 porin family protein [Niastella caeni]